MSKTLQSFSFKAAQEFAGKILVPIAKRVLEGKTVVLDTVKKSNIECMQCKKGFSGEDDLRKHIDAEHVLQNSEEDTDGNDCVSSTSGLKLRRK